MTSSFLNNDGISIVLGLLLVVLAGLLNGSWNVSFRPTHGYAVARGDDKASSSSSDLHYHQAFILFQVYAVCINIPICLVWAGGPTRVADVLQASTAVDILLVGLFSALWGVGTFGFALACQIAGLGLGTNLTMGIIMVLGAFLPLCLKGAIGTAAGGVVVTGLAVCSAGLALAVQSLQIRDVDEQRQRRASSNSSIALTTTMTTPTTAPTAAKHVTTEATIEAATTTIKMHDATVVENTKTTTIALVDDEAPEYSTTYKVGVCLVAGIFASQLQFAFVFGQDMIDLAKDMDDVPSSGTSAVIWLFALTLGAPASVAYGIYNNPPDQAWSRFYTCPWYRHVLIALTTSIPWVSHIHLYGFSTTQLPDDLAASVAWPILMMMTVVTGMLWSMLLGEWTHASPAAKHKLYQGLAAVTTGVVIIMASVSL